MVAVKPMYVCSTCMCVRVCLCVCLCVCVDRARRVRLSRAPGENMSQHSVPRPLPALFRFGTRFSAEHLLRSLRLSSASSPTKPLSY